MRRIPKPIKIKAPKLDVAGLGRAYEWMPVDKTAAFRLAFEWYKTNLGALLFRDPLDEERQRSYDRAVKAQTLGDRTNIAEEREHAWATALRLFERTWAARDLPRVDAALAAEQASPSRGVAAMGKVLASLNAVFDNWRMRFGVTMGDAREIVENSADPEILLPHAELAEMAAKPPLATVLAEVVPAAQACSAKVVNGEPTLDVALFMATLPAMLAAVGAWAAVAGQSALRAGKAVKVQRAPKAQTAGQPRHQAAAAMRGTIRVLDAFRSARFTGKSAAAAAILVDGMTAAAFSSELADVVRRSGWKKSSITARAFLKLLVDRRLIQVE